MSATKRPVIDYSQDYGLELEVTKSGQFSSIGSTTSAADWAHEPFKDPLKLLCHRNPFCAEQFCTFPKAILETANGIEDKVVAWEALLNAAQNTEQEWFCRAGLSQAKAWRTIHGLPTHLASVAGGSMADKLESVPSSGAAKIIQLVGRGPTSFRSAFIERGKAQKELAPLEHVAGFDWILVGTKAWKLDAAKRRHNRGKEGANPWPQALQRWENLCDELAAVLTFSWMACGCYLPGLSFMKLQGVVETLEALRRWSKLDGETVRKTILRLELKWGPQLVQEVDWNRKDGLLELSDRKRRTFVKVRLPP